MSSTQPVKPQADPSADRHSPASDTERQKFEPVPDLSESVAGEEDPGAALDLTCPSPAPAPGS